METVHYMSLYGTIEPQKIVFELAIFMTRRLWLYVYLAVKIRT
jgi:hypothetical protein